MEKKKATNKQILDAYGQSYQLMQKAKRQDDMLRKQSKSKNMSAKSKKKCDHEWFYVSSCVGTGGYQCYKCFKWKT